MFLYRLLGVQDGGYNAPNLTNLGTWCLFTCCLFGQLGSGSRNCRLVFSSSIDTYDIYLRKNFNLKKFQILIIYTRLKIRMFLNPISAGGGGS